MSKDTNTIGSIQQLTENKALHIAHVMPTVYVVCSAIHYEDNCKHVHQPKNIETGFVICGQRHHNCFMTVHILNQKLPNYKQTQGFLTSDNRFLDRKEAGELAYSCGQIKSPTKMLFSEDIY
jgi:hypothetical protein